MEFLGLTWVFIYFLLFSQCSLIIVNGTLTSKSPSVTTVAFFYRQQIKDTTQPRTRMLCSSTLNPYEILHISHLQLFKTLLRCHFCLVHFLKEERGFYPHQVSSTHFLSTKSPAAGCSCAFSRHPFPTPPMKLTAQQNRSPLFPTPVQENCSSSVIHSTWEAAQHRD